MEAMLGGLLPMDFMTCDMSEDENGTIGSVHEEEDNMNSDGHSPMSPMLTLTEGSEDLVLSKNSTGDASGDDGAAQEEMPRREYVNRGGELWDHWTWLGGQGKMSLMRCKYCANKQLKNAPKCRRHLIKCSGVPEHIRALFEKREAEANRVSAVMREIREKGIKMSRAAAGALAAEQSNTDPTSLTAAAAIAAGKVVSSTPQAKKIISSPAASPAQSLLNSSAPAALLMDNNRGKRKNSRTPSTTNGGVDLNGLNNLASVLAPYINQSTALQNGANKRGRVSTPSSSSLLAANNSNGRNAAATTPSVPANLDPTETFNLFYQQILASMPIQNAPAATTEPANEAAADADSKLTSSAASIAAFINQQSLKRKNSIVPGVQRPLDPASILAASMNTKNGKENKVQPKLQTNPANPAVLVNVEELNARMQQAAAAAAAAAAATENNPGLLLNTSITPPPPLEAAPNPIKAKKPKLTMDAIAENLKALKPPVKKPLKPNSDLNDLLVSALLTSGISLDFVSNPFFQEFVAKLSASPNYRAPTKRDLARVHLGNLAKNFESHTEKLFEKADSVVASFETFKLNDLSGNKMNVNLLFHSDENDVSLFFKSFDLTNNLSDLNNLIDVTINEIKPQRISAVILPYANKSASDLISYYLKSLYNHVIPLTNSYQLFDHFLANLCNLAEIRRLLDQCTAMFQMFTKHFDKPADSSIWTKVFESQHLKMYQHLMVKSNQSLSDKLNARFWFSIHLMLHWFLVAKEDLPERISQAETELLHKLNALMKAIELDCNDISKFFDKIEALFHFLTPFILAIHKIQFESSVISDVIKIFLDMKATFANNAEIMDNMNLIFEDDEARSRLDEVLTRYIQEDNFSDFYFLAYYLDPRYKQDKYIDDNETLHQRVFDALFFYADALGCHGEDGDAEALSQDITSAVKDFRSDSKIYGGSFLPPTPHQYWSTVSRFHFPGLPQLSYCATRIFSISTASFVNISPKQQTVDDLVGLPKSSDLESSLVSQVLPIKAFLKKGLSSASKSADKAENEVSLSRDSIANTVSNVILTLNEMGAFLEQHSSQAQASANAGNDEHAAGHSVFDDGDSGVATAHTPSTSDD